MTNWLVIDAHGWVVSAHLPQHLDGRKGQDRVGHQLCNSRCRSLVRLSHERRGIPGGASQDQQDSKDRGGREVKIQVGLKVKRKNITEVQTVVLIDKNIVIKNETGYFHTVSLAAYGDDYELVD